MAVHPFCLHLRRNGVMVILVFYLWFVFSHIDTAEKKISIEFITKWKIDQEEHQCFFLVVTVF